MENSKDLMLLHKQGGWTNPHTRRSHEMLIINTIGLH